MLENTRRTCEQYQRMIALGGDPREIVTGLAAIYCVNRPAIWRRLRTGGVLPPYRSGTSITRIRRRASEITADKDKQPRVDRDPCQRCGVRHDIGCRHSQAPLGMVL
jgi:hypothetical protein